MMVDVAILFVKKHFRHNKQAIHVEISQAFLDVLLSEGQRAFLVMKLVHALANSVIEANFWQITAKGTFCNFEALFQKFLANKLGRNRSAVFVAFNNGFSSSSGKCWVDRLLRRPTFLGSLGSSLAISRRMASCATFTPTPVTRASSLLFDSFFPHLVGWSTAVQIPLDIDQNPVFIRRYGLLSALNGEVFRNGSKNII